MKLKMLSIAIAILLVLIGCQSTNNDREGAADRNNNNIEQTRYNDDGVGNNRDNRNNRMNETNRNNLMNDGNRNDGNNGVNNNRNKNQGNDQYDVSKEAADKITDEISEIDRAYVLTTKNNAYVAAVLDNDTNKNNINNTNNRNDSNINSTNNRKNGKNNNTNIAKNGNDNRGDELTDEVKNKISDIVQSVDKDIDNVFVTTNPDFADLTNDYVDDVNNNKSVRGFFDQIGNMIERVFPQNKK